MRRILSILFAAFVVAMLALAWSPSTVAADEMGTSPTINTTATPPAEGPALLGPIDYTPADPTMPILPASDTMEAAACQQKREMSDRVTCCWWAIRNNCVVGNTLDAGCVAAQKQACGIQP